MLLVASEDATDGYTTTFTVVAQSALDESNDFAVFKVTITTRPPPQFSDNVSKSRNFSCIIMFMLFAGVWSALISYWFEWVHYCAVVFPGHYSEGELLHLA